MALSHANISVELREILLSDRPAEIYAISPKGTVPVLELPDGTVIDESYDIMQWALDQTQTDWMEVNLDNQLAMIKVNDEEFKPWLNKYKYHEQHPDHPMKFYQEKCAEILFTYEKILTINSYFMGEKVQWVDVSIFPFVRQFAHVDLPYFETIYPLLNRWLERWKASELFQSVMKKYTQWQPDHAPLIVSFSS
ncbi:MAG: glutathione S-transferase [Candidatus Marinimicrobia bacterium]|nr:glutathione S-transferase [Candidatus Neomarinimicrobiota bacterium]MBT6637901.1 glutathione S-transferase [Candidatus Neomarinimicrobiota bacterium]MBT6841989.1 glutathione S-transferase [Candidatus Neomarinimicrobiota bacterium]MBT7195142.1 glutathione S-transferase [Candidatus Neomarinimicrobiota bacterium]